MEWIIVDYPRVRDVFVDGRRTGQARELLIVREGTQVFDLGVPADYQPSKRKVRVTNTSEADPMTIAFSPKESANG
jgi:hypothetical protein